VIAVDTNVLVRLLTNDNVAQATRAAAVFRAGPVFVPKTVLLESEWVLRYSYGLPTAAIARAFLALLGLPTVTIEDAPASHLAIRMLERGIDFADALHLASSAAAERFVTFDARLVKRARKDSPVPVMLA
jgi:predicted nucleic-acid-binding protein